MQSDILLIVFLRKPTIFCHLELDKIGVWGWLVPIAKAPLSELVDVLSLTMQKKKNVLFQGSDSAPQSAASSKGSDESRWSTASDGTQSDDRSGGRARWGDRGVGVGHLWAPGEEAAPGNPGGDSLPPAWAEKEEENVLPGAPYSKPEQR